MAFTLKASYISSNLFALLCVSEAIEKGARVKFDELD